MHFNEHFCGMTLYNYALGSGLEFFWYQTHVNTRHGQCIGCR